MKSAKAFKNILKLAFALFLLPGSITPALAQQGKLADFYADKGCAISVATELEAAAAGFDQKTIETFRDTAARHAQAVNKGGWLLLPPDICTIRPPQIDNALELTDPDVIQAISAPQPDLTQDGCTFNLETLFDTVRLARGWDDNRINLEYLRLMGASLLSGEVAFYSDSNLRTPPGFQLLTGPCADRRDIENIRQDHDLLITFFDPLMRTNGASVECETGGLAILEVTDAGKRISDGKLTNAWLAMELMIVSMGAGWFDGQSKTSKGIPHPPFCHYR